MLNAPIFFNIFARTSSFGSSHFIENQFRFSDDFLGSFQKNLCLKKEKRNNE